MSDTTTSERGGILDAIRDAKGNITRAAEKLGVARRTLQNRMRFYGIARGKAGRRKMKISYRRKKKFLIAGAAAAAIVGYVVVKGRSKP